MRGLLASCWDSGSVTRDICHIAASCGLTPTKAREKTPQRPLRPMQIHREQSKREQVSITMCTNSTPRVIMCSKEHRICKTSVSFPCLNFFSAQHVVFTNDCLCQILEKQSDFILMPSWKYSKQHLYFSEAPLGPCNPCWSPVHDSSKLYTCFISDFIPELVKQSKRLASGNPPGASHTCIPTHTYTL